MHGKTLHYDRRSLYVFSHVWAIRKAAVWLAEWFWFERVIIMLIFLNSIFLASYDYRDTDNKTTRNQVVELSGIAFSIIFTLECAIKIVSMGFYQHKNAYLRDGWNWIDFIVVIVGIIEVIPGIPNLRALRTLRVLRPLKSIKAIPSMRLLILSLLRSLPALANVVLFLLFMFIMFGILGVQLFAGRLYSRCRLTQVPVSHHFWPID